MLIGLFASGRDICSTVKSMLVMDECWVKHRGFGSVDAAFWLPN